MDRSKQGRKICEFVGPMPVWKGKTRRMENPNVRYPLIIEGYVSGNRLRLESLDGSEMLMYPLDTAPNTPLQWKNNGFYLQNFGPYRSPQGVVYGVTHLQKYSPYGWLKVDPDCYHWWRWIKTQQQDQQGTWIPGSEVGIYFRKSRKLFQLECWRWDRLAPDYWVRSGGYFGGHFDWKFWGGFLCFWRGVLCRSFFGTVYKTQDEIGEVPFR